MVKTKVQVTILAAPIDESNGMHKHPSGGVSGKRARFRFAVPACSAPQRSLFVRSLGATGRGYPRGLDTPSEQSWRLHSTRVTVNTKEGEKPSSSSGYMVGWLYGYMVIYRMSPWRECRGSSPVWMYHHAVLSNPVADGAFCGNIELVVSVAGVANPVPLSLLRRIERVSNSGNEGGYRTAGAPFSDFGSDIGEK